MTLHNHSRAYSDKNPATTFIHIRASMVLIVGKTKEAQPSRQNCQPCTKVSRLPWMEALNTQLHQTRSDLLVENIEYIISKALEKVQINFLWIQRSYLSMLFHCLPTSNFLEC